MTSNNYDNFNVIINIFIITILNKYHVYNKKICPINKFFYLIFLFNYYNNNSINKYF